MLAQQIQAHVSTDELKNIFLNIEKILQFHEKLYARLESTQNIRWVHLGKPAFINEIEFYSNSFIESKRDLLCYSFYCANVGKALTLLEVGNSNGMPSHNCLYCLLKDLTAHRKDFGAIVKSLHAASRQRFELKDLLTFAVLHRCEY